MGLYVTHIVIYFLRRSLGDKDSQCIINGYFCRYGKKDGDDQGADTDSKPGNA